MSYTLACTVDLTASSNGATIHAQLYDSAGDAYGAAITSGVVELLTGIFQLVVTVPDGFVGSLVFYEDGDTSNRAAVSINPAETENADAKTSTRSSHSAANVVTAMQAVSDDFKADVSGVATSSALSTVDTNVDAILAAVSSGGVAVSSTTMNAIADALLSRSVSNVEDTASLHSMAEIILAMLESSAPNTTWTIYKTDGSTTFNTRTLTEDGVALPVVGVA